MSPKKRTKRARFAAIAKIHRQNCAAARQASADLLTFGTCITYTDGDRLKRIDPRETRKDFYPPGTHVQELDPMDQRRVINKWYDELAKLTHAR